MPIPIAFPSSGEGEGKKGGVKSYAFIMVVGAQLSTCLTLLPSGVGHLSKTCLYRSEGIPIVVSIAKTVRLHGQSSGRPVTTPPCRGYPGIHVECDHCRCCLIIALINLKYPSKLNIFPEISVDRKSQERV
jgi:hypothetical protein